MVDEHAPIPLIDERRLAALTTLVRGVVDEIGEAGGPVVPEFRETLDLADAAARGKRASARRAAQLMRAVVAEYRRYSVHGSARERAVYWVTGPLMQLLVMAERHEDRAEKTLTNVGYALGSLREIDWSEYSTMVQERYEAALTAHAGLSDEPLPARKAGTRSGPTAAAVRALSRSRDALPPYARPLLDHAGAIRNTKLIGTRPRLSEALREHGLPLHLAVLDFERLFGGILIPESEEPHWVLGAYACLTTSGNRVGRTPESLVPVAYDQHDNAMVLDADGRPFSVDLIEGGDPVPIGTTGPELVAAVLGFELLEHRGSPLPPGAGIPAELAAVLNLTPVVAADPLHLWVGADAVVTAGYSPRVVTFTDAAARVVGEYDSAGS